MLVSFFSTCLNVSRTMPHKHMLSMGLEWDEILICIEGKVDEVTSINYPANYDIQDH